MNAAVIICTRDRPALLAGAAAAAAADLREGDELTVVDSASADPAAVAAVAGRVGAALVRCGAPGVSRARNAGAAATTAPVLLFTDDDCRPRRGWIEAMSRPFEEPDTGFVTGRVVPDRPGGRVLSVVLDAHERIFGADDHPSSFGSGANMAFRRDAFNAVGRFDEAFGPGARFLAAEDHELFWRVLRGGWRGHFRPEGVVVHEQWRGLGAFLMTNYRYGTGSGALAAKVRNAEGERGRNLLWHALLDVGLRRALSHLRSGYESGALASLAFSAGVAIGHARGARYRWASPGEGGAVDGAGELGRHFLP